VTTGRRGDCDSAVEKVGNEHSSPRDVWIKPVHFEKRSSLPKEVADVREVHASSSGCVAKCFVPTAY